MTDPEPNEDPRVEPLDARGKQYIVRDHVQGVIHVALLLATARTFGWLNAWLVGAVVLAIKSVAAITLLRINPALLNVRGAKPEMSARERVFFVVLVSSSLALPIVAGLDAGAVGWTHHSAVELAVGVAVMVGGGAITIAAMAVNAFFEPTVRLQEDRGQRVCSAGPYRLVRHPGYVGTILVVTAMPFVVGSRWALIPVAVQIVALVVRTAYEDRMLQDELEGYAEYAKQTRYRLLPGLW